MRSKGCVNLWVDRYKFRRKFDLYPLGKILVVNSPPGRVLDSINFISPCPLPKVLWHLQQQGITRSLGILTGNQDRESHRVLIDLQGPWTQILTVNLNINTEGTVNKFVDDFLLGDMNGCCAIWQNRFKLILVAWKLIEFNKMNYILVEGKARI